MCARFYLVGLPVPKMQIKISFKNILLKFPFIINKTKTEGSSHGSTFKHILAFDDFVQYKERLGFLNNMWVANMGMILVL